MATRPRLRHAAVAAVFAALCGAARLSANCGSATCPIDPQSLNLPGARQFTFDLSFQYIDQSRIAIGTRSASVGEIRSAHDEVRTVNRVGTLLASWAPSDRLILSVSAPWVSRFHEHVEESSGDTERWRFDAFGDLSLGARYRVAPDVWATVAVKLPTGKRRPVNDEGEPAEVTLAPGTGSTDVTVGAVWVSQSTVPSLSKSVLGRGAAMPYFVGASYKVNGSGTDRYRLGDELLVNAGLYYPVLRNLQAMLQVNARIKAKDDVGDTDEVRDHTGGSFVYASPGVRVAMRGGFAVYGTVQIPVYQRVNGIQLTSRANFLTGIQARF